MRNIGGDHAPSWGRGRGSGGQGWRVTGTLDDRTVVKGSSRKSGGGRRWRRTDFVRAGSSSSASKAGM